MFLTIAMMNVAATARQATAHAIARLQLIKSHGVIRLSFRLPPRWFCGARRSPAGGTRPRFRKRW